MVQVLLEWMDRDGVQVDIDAVCTAIARARAGWTPLRAAWIGAVIQAGRSRGGGSGSGSGRGSGGRVLGGATPQVQFLLFMTSYCSGDDKVVHVLSASTNRTSFRK